MLGTPDHTEAPTPIDMGSLPDGIHTVRSGNGMLLTVFVYEGRLTEVGVHHAEERDSVKVFTNQETVSKKKKNITRDDGDSFSCTTLTVRSDA